ncbi:MAG: DUF3228 family protein [Patescibacteria group bacterium]
MTNENTGERPSVNAEHSDAEQKEGLTISSAGMTEFVKRHFKKDFAGTKISSHTPEEFEQELAARLAGATVKPGYADFCRLLFVENFTDARVGSVEITDENRGEIRNGFEARRENELPVLTRWAEGVETPAANYLGIVLYRQDQLRKEAEASGEADVPAADWGIVKIMGLPTPEAEPIDPTTMLRNALGKEYGGSGVPLDPEEYKKSVEYWDKRVTVK